MYKRKRTRLKQLKKLYIKNNGYSYGSSNSRC